MSHENSEQKSLEQAKKNLENFLDSIEDPVRQDRLRKMQWSIDQKLNLCKNDYQRNLVIQEMMWESFLKLNQELQKFSK